MKGKNVHIGPQTKAADALHQMKYRGQGEDFRELCNRVAFWLQDTNAHYREFREIMLTMRFMPGGRIQTAGGSLRLATPYNCFVSGTFLDSFVDGLGCIHDRLRQAGTTMRLGGGIGYDFTPLRPRGDLVRSQDTHASGPVDFMRLFDVQGDIVTAAGHRHGAQMGILRVDHPDIEEFIHCKQNDHAYRRFNLSIAVTDEFMQAVQAEKPFDLQFGGKVYKTIEAKALWEMIMRSTWDWGEPGVFFVDRVNQMNNLWYHEEIAACNPCAEQPLPPFGACLLGSFNLVKYLKPGGLKIVSNGRPELAMPRWEFDYDQLVADIPHVVRAMDNVVDRARYPLAEQKAEAVTKRRMGLGVTGLANCIEAVGHPYGSKNFLETQSQILETIMLCCYRASSALAEEKGSFPLFDAERYLQSGFMKTMPGDLRERIRLKGMRNSHLTSIAPTGTISMCADNVSSSVEPVYAYEVDRPVTTPEGTVVMKVEDYGVKFLGVKGKLAHEVTAQEHLQVLATAQNFTDSAVSKTINMDSRMPWDDFKDLYWQAWQLGCKSCTTFNADGMRGALLKRHPQQSVVAADDLIEGDSCRVDPETGRQSCE